MARYWFVSRDTCSQAVRQAVSAWVHSRSYKEIKSLVFRLLEKVGSGVNRSGLLFLLNIRPERHQVTRIRYAVR